MPITIQEVEHVAKLACLRLSEKEKEKFTHQLNEILTYVEKLNELDTTNVEPLSHINELSNVVRDDNVEVSYPVEEMLKNAPSRSDKFFKVPNVLSGKK